MRIPTGPDFQIQCILYGKWQNPDCEVRIAVDGLDTNCLNKRHNTPSGDTVYQSRCRRITTVHVL